VWVHGQYRTLWKVINHGYIQRVIGDTLLVTTTEYINAFQLRWKKPLKPSTAKKAKTIFLQDSDTTHARQFDLLPSYIYAVKKADPSAYCHLSVDSMLRFRSVFISPFTAKTTFLHCSSSSLLMEHS
jgi:hypothetical protein